jgi:uncharacterized protein
VFVGMLTLDVLLGDVRSLKQKRGCVRPVVAELQRRFAVSAGEVGDPDLYRRALLGVATVSRESAQCGRVLDACERLVADRPELELLAAHRRLVNDDDD